MMDMYALLMGGSGGGGGLPTPTANDVGAGLCVVKKATVTEGDVIVPEQTVTTGGNSHSASLSNVVTSLVAGGTECVVVINGETYTAVIDDEWYLYPIGDTGCSVNFNENSFNSPEDGTYTVKVCVASVSYSYEWGVDPYAAWDFVAKINWDTYSGEVVKGDYATVRAKMEAHTPCAFLVFGYGANNPTSDAMFTDVGYALNESAIFLQLSSGSGWLWYPNNTLESDD